MKNITTPLYTDSQVVKTTSEHGITTFNDATILSKVKNDSTQPQLPLVYPLGDFTAKAMLTRPQLFKTITWNSSYTGEAIDFPSTALYALFADYTAYFEYIRTKWRVQFRFNSTPFQQGSLIIGYLPYNPTTSYDDCTTKSVSMMNSVIITAAGEKQVDYLIPYQNPYAGISLPAATEGEQATLFIRPLTTFRTLGGAPSSIKISVWISMEDPLLYGFSQSDSTSEVITKQTLTPSTPITPVQTIHEQELAKEATMKNDNILMKTMITGASNTLKTVPYVGPVWKAIAEFLNDNTFSKPISTKAATALVNYPLRSATTADGSVHAEPVNGQFSAVLHPYDYPGTNGTAALNTIVMKPALYRVLTFADTSVGGSTDVSFHPWLVGSGSGRWAHDYLSYVTSGFVLWRGSIRIKLLIVTNSLTSGRLQLTYRTRGTATDSGNLVQQVVEFKGETSYYFSIPYIDRRYWRKVDYRGDSDNQLTKTSISFKLLDMVSADTSVTNYIDIAIFRSAGPDYQVAGIREPLLANDFEAESQSGNLNNLFETTAFPMLLSGKSEVGHIPTIGVEYGMCNTEHPYSPVQLAKRPGTVQNSTPMEIGTADALSYQAIDRIPIRYWPQMFRFWRGSINAMSSNNPIYQEFGSLTQTTSSPVYYPPTQTAFSLFQVPYIAQTPYRGMWRDTASVEQIYNNPYTLPGAGVYGATLYQMAGDDLELFHLVPPYIYPATGPANSKKDHMKEGEIPEFNASTAKLHPPASRPGSVKS